MVLTQSERVCAGGEGGKVLGVGERERGTEFVVVKKRKSLRVRVRDSSFLNCRCPCGPQ